MAVEAVRVAVDGIDGDETASRTLGGAEDSLECVREQLGSEPSALERAVESEARDEVPGDLAVAGAERALWQVDAGGLGWRHRVARHHCRIVLGCPHRRVSGTRSVCTARLVAQPSIEGIVAAAQRCQVVIGPERLRGPRVHARR
jgi:hypothetical protein